MIKLFTLAMVFEDSAILLGLKKRGFGQGKWNGFGGKVDPDETIEQAAHRELFEESGLTAHSLTKQGILTFEFVGDPVLMEVHVFVTNSFTGRPRETEEMRPQWYHLKELPFGQMWVDDVMWFPLLLAGKFFKGYFKFSDYETIVDHRLEELSTQPD